MKHRWIIFALAIAAAALGLYWWSPWADADDSDSGSDTGDDDGSDDLVSSLGSTMPMTASQNLINFVKQNEKLELTAYNTDGSGTWTIGYGHTAGVYPGMTITEDQANEFLQQDIDDAQNIVNNTITVPLDQNQFDALVSLAENWGFFRKSASTIGGVIARLNSGDYEGFVDQLRTTAVTGGGKILGGLEKLRAEEAAMFSGDAS